MQASSPPEDPVRGCGFCLPQLAPTVFSEWAKCPMRATVPYTLSWLEVPGPSFWPSVFMWVGDMLGNVVSRNMCGPLYIMDSIQFYEHNHSDHVNLV